MKTLIIYAGKYGCTQQCADELKSKMAGAADIIDAGKNTPKDISQYDNIIIGSSVYIGQVNKKIKSFVNNNLNTLLSKNIGLFLVCGFAENWEETLSNNFPKELIAAAKSTQCFGGELNVDKMGFMHKKMVEFIQKEADTSTIKMMPQNIDKMAAAFAE